MVKNLPARETWVRSLGWEDALEEGMTTHSSIFARRIPMDRGAWGLLLGKKEHSHTHVVCVHVCVCVYTYESLSQRNK